ncbi:MAG: purine-nucleoside phosphorylase [Kiritimatiellia bacterium]|jgi:purine-nucleoside phosphorylase
MDTKIFDEAFAALPERVRGAKPGCVLMLGSGWSRAVEGLEILVEVPYGAIPHFGDVTVIGHSGRLLLVRAPGGGQALVFCGRRHWYEGASWEAIVMPVEIARRLGCRLLLVTNASGGIRPDLEPGDMVVIRDHLRMHHLNPLRGPHNPDFGPRFPDQSHVYDPEMVELLLEAGRETGNVLTTGVYVFASGPAYETPAEIRAYGMLGADLVGMSTVPEAMFANACGFRVAGLSFVSNHAAGIAKHSLSGAEVVECAERNSEKMAAVVLAFLKKIP